MDILPYKLLDSGDGRKLEQVGPYIVDRQASVAVWRPRLPAAEWRKVHALHQRSDKGGGHWENKAKVPEQWQTRVGSLVLNTKLTSFGHLGFFAEQMKEWEWFRSSAKKLKAASPERPLRLLNLFGYTGCTSLSLAQGGAEVTHVDAAKGIVDWGRSNQLINDIPADSIRWIIDDCQVFCERELRRGKKYDGVILDPPSYGRGPKNEIFKIEDQLPGLLTAISKVLEPEPRLIHFSCHTPGFSASVLDNLVRDFFSGTEEMKSEPGEMLIDEAGHASGKAVRQLASGSRVRLLRT